MFFDAGVESPYLPRWTRRTDLVAPLHSAPNRKAVPCTDCGLGSGTSRPRPSRRTENYLNNTFPSTCKSDWAASKPSVRLPVPSAAAYLPVPPVML